MMFLDRLSDAVILSIRDAVAGDLAAHVALSQTCRRLRDVYRNNDPEVFWQFACYRAGFGKPIRRNPPGDGADGPSWKDIALALVNHALHCEIKSCRSANAYFGKFYSNTTGINILDQRTNTMPLHHLYYYLHFNAVPSTPDLVPPNPAALPQYPDPLSILVTHLPTFPESRQSQYGPLCLHPNACCAFTTYPPTRSLTLYDAQGRAYLTVENPNGCTVLDVNRGLADILPYDLSYLLEAFSHYQNIQLTSGLSLTQFADSVRQNRGFLDDHEYPYLEELTAQA